MTRITQAALKRKRSITKIIARNKVILLLGYMK
jgi:hypothetical protein